MRKMYKKPETETIPVQMDSAICSASKVSFGSGAANGGNAALAPKKSTETKSF